VPKQVTGRGLRISVRSAGEIHLAAIEIDMNRVGEAGAIRKASR